LIVGIAAAEILLACRRPSGNVTIIGGAEVKSVIEILYASRGNGIRAGNMGSLLREGNSTPKERLAELKPLTPS
jgi:hypothetical protein